MNSLCVLPMEARHLPQAAELEQLCFSTPWSQAALAAELEKPEALFLAAEAQDRLVGYLGLNTVLDEGYIANLAVHPDHRRRGIAQALLQALLAAGEQRGLAFVTLEVRPSNIPAQALYRKMGFAEVGRRRDFYSHPTEDGLLMTYYYNRNGETT